MRVCPLYLSIRHKTGMEGQTGKKKNEGQVEETTPTGPIGEPPPLGAAMCPAQR